MALTEAGERLLADAQPVLDGTNRAFEAVNAFRDKPTGTLRLSMTRAVASLLVGSLLPQFLAQFPDIKLEVSADDTHSDIVSSRFDAGIRIGERIAKDMIAVRVLEEQHRVAVASPAYLAHHPAPATPQDLHAHNCVRLRSDWDASIQPWVFENADRRLEIDVDGSLVLNDWSLVVNAAVAGIGVGYVPERLISSHIANGHLVRLLENWRGIVSGVFLYYPSRRQMPGALRAFIDFMRAQCDAVSATLGGTNSHSGSDIRADSHNVAPTP